jgi:hypothetical protein
MEQRFLLLLAESLTVTEARNNVSCNDRSSRRNQKGIAFMTVKRPKTCLIVLLITCCLGIAEAGQPAANAAQTFSGEVMDDICAKNKSHDKMMQQMKSMTSDPAICTKKCVQLGAHYVLYDRQQGTIYKLDNPEKAEPFAGKAVQISGTLEKNKLKIANIEAIGPASGAK